MIFSTKRGKMLLGVGTLAVAALSFGTARYAIGSDHAGTVVTAQTRKGADLSDLHIFPGSNPNNVVLSMAVHPLIPAGNPGKVVFDPNVLYQFKIDNNNDNGVTEDLVIQARFQGTGRDQKVFISGPVKPSRTGTVTQFEKAYSTTGTFNTAFSPTANMRVFAGLRSDPFFIDLAQLFAILPDRADPLEKTPKTPAGQANTPQVGFFRPKGQAQDFLANTNVLGLVIELPKSQLVGSGNGKIRVWETTSVAN